jgi:fatty-acid desaturase
MRNETMIKERPKGINWHTAIFMGLLHVGAVAALFVFTWQALLTAILLWWISASLGVGMGFHRLQKQMVGRAAHLWGGWHNNHHAHPTAARHGLAW